MAILIVGAGATGGYFGLRLAQAGRDVSFLVRPRRAEVLRERGLRVVGPAGEERIDPVLVATGAIDRTYDTILLSVKATAVDAAVADLAPAVGADTRVVPGLNGMAHMDVLNQRFGSEVVLGGVVKVATQLNEHGDILLFGPNASMEIGAQDGKPSDRLDEVAAELGGAGFDFSVPDDIVAAMWSKWALIATLGALTCFMRSPVGDIVACPGGAELGPTILRETTAVAAAAGYPVPEATIAGTAAMVSAAGSPATSSMYRDLVAGAPTEGEQILGDLATQARRLGVPTPVLDLATLHVRVYEQRRTQA